MTTLLHLTFTLFAMYIAFVIQVNRGVPASISDSFYILNRRKKGAGYVFTGWCYAIGISTMVMMFELSADAWYQFLGLFAGGGLCFVGTAPLFKSCERLIHYASAATCALAAALWMVFAGYWWVLIPFPFAFLARRNRMFWVEVVLFLAMYATLFMTQLKSYADI